MDAAREHDIKQSVIEGWIDTFLEYGRQGLKDQGPSQAGAERARAADQGAQGENWCADALR